METGFGKLGFEEDVAKLEVDFCAVKMAVEKWNSWVDAEAGLGVGVDVKEIGDVGGEGVAVEDFGMAEDVHEEGVGAVGGVELHPLPLFAGAGAAGCGVDFGEAAKPGGVGADVFVGGRVEVAVATMFVAAEDDYGVGAGRCSWRRFWVLARWFARALRSRRSREADHDVEFGRVIKFVVTLVVS